MKRASSQTLWDVSDDSQNLNMLMSYSLQVIGIKAGAQMEQGLEGLRQDTDTDRIMTDNHSRYTRSNVGRI